ncbi:MAG: glycosyltransferase [Candidatus Scalindua rubra]|uniref:Glycosyltransferase n=1 Tax=Candidatus Scalindua rubra TaxID=1872076 RepID=A0A1E3XFQ8_9BACT|nr:MAG: glycosyltransferase [Candidatus Scalindua rubra]
MNGASIIIPVYNEEDIIVSNTNSLIKYLNSLGIVYEIILSGNGSTDKTDELGKQLTEQNSEVKALSTNEKGVGIAFKNAISEAKYEKIVSLDMDMTVNLSFVKRAIDLLDTHDIIIGSKIFGVQRRSFVRKLGSRVFVIIASMLLNLKFNDYSPSGKAYRKGVVQKYLNHTDNGTSYVIETIYKAFKDNYRIIQITIDCDDRRKSKFNLLHEGFYRYYHLFKLIFGSLSK